MEVAAEQAHEPAGGAPLPDVSREEEDVAVPPPPAPGRGVAVAAAGLAAAWTGFVVWATATGPGLMHPADAASLVATWAMPLVLLWLVAQALMRAGGGPAARVADSLRALDAEAASLDSRLAAINGELSIARGFLEAQTRDLDSFGRLAVERLGQNASELRSLIDDNGARIDAIGNVSTAARENMEALRGQLPVLASAAKDVANNVASAGRTAQDHLKDLAAGMNRLNEFGVACERQTATVRARMDEAMHLLDARLEDMDSATEARLAALSARAADLGAAMDAREAEAQAALRLRAGALTQEIGDARQALDTREAEALASLRARLGALRDEAGTITRALRDAETRALDEWGTAVSRIEDDVRTAIATLEAFDQQAIAQARARLEGLVADANRAEDELAAAAERADADLARRHADQAGRMSTLRTAQDKALAAVAEVEARIAAAAASTETAEASLRGRLEAVAESLDANLARAGEADRALASLTASSDRLLRQIGDVARIGRDDVPAAFAEATVGLGDLADAAAGLRTRLAEAATSSHATAGEITAANSALERAAAALAALHAAVDAQTAASRDKVEALRDALGEAAGDADALARRAGETLGLAIERLTTATHTSVRAIETDGAAAITALAEQLGATAASSLERALRNHAGEMTGQIEQSAAHAAGVAREAGQQLRSQIVRVEEAVAALETRVADARTRAEDEVDNDFSRRAAVITEALKSNAIDIARVLDTEVTDTAWAGYLKGDRGIFARRALRLVEGTEAKAIVAAYENDDAFRGHVNHYIHDFEAMLRQLLATRDGHTLGVTLLSSDLGKLYVALAQAIDRLRG